MQFQRLFEPLTIRNITLRNRIMMSAHSKDYTTEELAYYTAERSKGGAGLIVDEATAVHPTSKARQHIIEAWDPSSVPEYRIISDLCHEHGAMIFGQIYHTGGQGDTGHSLLPLWGPSEGVGPGGEMIHAMTVREIQEVVRGHAIAARHMKQGGYDGVEIHSANGYIMCQFLSPQINKRTDGYGGSFENRSRILFETVRAVREEVGPDFVVGVRLVGDEFVDGGIELADSTNIAKLLDATGAIDFISVSNGNRNTYWAIIPPMDVPRGAFAHVSAAIKEVVKVPVFSTGRVNDPAMAERLIAEGAGDVIGMCRQLLCDPETPNKAREGRLDEIRICMACVQGCRNKVNGKHTTCTQNPAAGYEKKLGSHTFRMASVKKKVMVIGGGPSGMTTAHIASQRGHNVSLIEKSDRLGGQIHLAMMPPHRQELGESIRYLQVMCEKSSVKLRLNTAATPELVLAEQPDVVVVATGSTPLVPGIQGARQPHVLNYWEALQGAKPIGQRVLVVDGGIGFWQAAGTADFLASQGKNVEIISPHRVIGQEINSLNIPLLLERFNENNVKRSPETRLKSIEADFAVVVDVVSKIEREIEVDTVVLAMGNTAVDDIYRALEGKAKEVYVIGDAAAPRRLDYAIRDGFMLARAI